MFYVQRGRGDHRPLIDSLQKRKNVVGSFFVNCRDELGLPTIGPSHPFSLARSCCGQETQKNLVLQPLCVCFGIFGAQEIGCCSRMRFPPPKGLKLTLYPLCGNGLICIVMLMHIMF